MDVSNRLLRMSTVCCKCNYYFFGSKEIYNHLRMSISDLVNQGSVLNCFISVHLFDTRSRPTRVPLTKPKMFRWID